MTPRTLALAGALLLVASGCGDDDDNTPDAGITADSAATRDSGPVADAGPDVATPPGPDAAPDPDAATPPSCKGVAQVALSSGFVCSLACGGAVSCKRLDDGSAVAAPGWTDVDQIAAGRGASGTGELVARRASGDLVTWPLTGGAETPVALTDVETVSGGDAHFCAKHKDGTASCWGRQDFGQLGLGLKPGEPAPASKPSKIPETDIRAIAAGGHATCVIRADRTVACAGSLSPNAADGSFGVVAALGSGAERIHMGGGEPDAAACAEDSAGKLSCTYDKLQAPAGVPTSVAVGTTAICIVTAGEMICDGEVFDTENKVMVSVEPTGLPDPVSVVTDNVRWCAVTTADEVWCWGGAAWDEAATTFWP